MKFKFGDKVKVVSCTWLDGSPDHRESHFIGEEGVIVVYDNKVDYPYRLYIEDRGPVGWFHGGDLELVIEEEHAFYITDATIKLYEAGLTPEQIDSVFELLTY